MEAVIRADIRAVIGWAAVKRGNAYIRGHIAFQLAFQPVHHGADVQAGTEDVINDQQAVVMVQIFQQILSAVDADIRRVIDHILIRMQKRFLTEQSVIEDSFRLGAEIYRSGFRPTFMGGQWRTNCI